MNNMEWVAEGDRMKYLSKKPIAKNFYKTPANLYEVHVKDFDLIVNPVIQFSISKRTTAARNFF